MSDTLIGRGSGTQGRLCLLRIKLIEDKRTAVAITAYAESKAVSTQPSSSESSQCGFSKLSLKLSMILWDHKIRKSRLNSESEAPRHAYMSTLKAKSKFETSMIEEKTIPLLKHMHYFLQKYSHTHTHTHTHMERELSLTHTKCDYIKNHQPLTSFHCSLELALQQ